MSRLSWVGVLKLFSCITLGLVFFSPISSALSVDEFGLYIVRSGTELSETTESDTPFSFKTVANGNDISLHLFRNGIRADTLRFRLTNGFSGIKDLKTRLINTGRRICVMRDANTNNYIILTYPTEAIIGIEESSSLDKIIGGVCRPSLSIFGLLRLKFTLLVSGVQEKLFTDYALTAKQKKDYEKYKIKVLVPSTRDYLDFKVYDSRGRGVLVSSDPSFVPRAHKGYFYATGEAYRKSGEKTSAEVFAMLGRDLTSTTAFPVAVIWYKDAPVRPSPSPRPSPAPISGQWKTVKATTFCTSEDGTSRTASNLACPNTNKKFVALPVPIRDTRGEHVEVCYQNKCAFATVDDVGPWCTKDRKYVFGNAPPFAQTHQGRILANVPGGGASERNCNSRYPSNGAGIDLSPALAAAIGAKAKGLTTGVRWRFVA